MVSLQGVSCNGLELDLLSCSHSTNLGTECGPREDAGVVCQRMFEIAQLWLFKF